MSSRTSENPIQLVVSHPKDAKIRKYIECYYYLRTKEAMEKYAIYPSNRTVLEYFFNANNQVNGTTITITESNIRDKFEESLVGPFNQALHISYTGSVELIAIIFKDHGLYQFGTQNHYFLNQKILSDPACFPELQTLILESRATMKPDQILACIDDYFTDAYQELKLEQLDSCIAAMHANPDVSLDELIDITQWSKKTIIHYFKKYLGRTPAHYKAVMKYRKALLQDSSNLTSLGMEVGYYDQSHMIRGFRKFTGHTPSHLKKKTNLSNFKSIQWLK